MSFPYTDNVPINRAPYALCVTHNNNDHIHPRLMSLTSCITAMPTNPNTSINSNMWSDRTTFLVHDCTVTLVRPHSTYRRPLHTLRCFQPDAAPLQPSHNPRHRYRNISALIAVCPSPSLHAVNIKLVKSLSTVYFHLLYVAFTYPHLLFLGNTVWNNTTLQPCSSLRP